MISKMGNKLKDRNIVAVLGPKGTFSHTVAEKMFTDSSEFIFTPTIEHVFDEVCSGSAKFGVVPIENYVGGLVLETLDSILEYPITVIGSCKLKINHNLLSYTDDPGTIKKIRSHPQVLTQCRKWLNLNYPSAEREAQNSSTFGISKFAKDTSIAYIGQKETAEKYGLKILAENIEDRKGNATEFYVLAHTEDGILKDIPGPGKTLMIISIKDRPGILRDILSVFADLDINLTKLHSRTLGINEERDWDYYFFLEADCLPGDDDFMKAMVELYDLCLMIMIFGVSRDLSSESFLTSY